MNARTESRVESPRSLLDERRSSPGLLLALLGQHAMRRLREAHNRHQISPRQFELLGLLYDGGPVGQRALGRAMAIDPSILVTLLNPLEIAGLISRQRDAGDRRRHLVRLTAEGERRLVDAARAQRETEDELFSALDAAQREQLRTLLVILKEGASGPCDADDQGHGC